MRTENTLNNIRTGYDSQENNLLSSLEDRVSKALNINGNGQNGPALGGVDQTTDPNQVRLGISEMRVEHNMQPLPGMLIQNAIV